MTFGMSTSATPFRERVLQAMANGALPNVDEPTLEAKEARQPKPGSSKSISAREPEENRDPMAPVSGSTKAQTAESAAKKASSAVTGGGAQRSDENGAIKGSSDTSVDPRTLFVSNLEPWVTDRKLYSACTPFGEITACRIATMRNGRSRGFGFVSYATEDASRAALKGLAGKKIGSTEITVAIAQRRPSALPQPGVRRTRRSPRRSRDQVNLGIAELGDSSPPSQARQGRFPRRNGHFRGSFRGGRGGLHQVGRGGPRAQYGHSPVRIWTHRSPAVWGGRILPASHVQTQWEPSADPMYTVSARSRTPHRARPALSHIQEHPTAPRSGSWVAGVPPVSGSSQRPPVWPRILSAPNLGTQGLKHNDRPLNPKAKAFAPRSSATKGTGTRVKAPAKNSTVKGFGSLFLGHVGKTPWGPMGLSTQDKSATTQGRSLWGPVGQKKDPVETKPMPIGPPGRNSKPQSLFGSSLPWTAAARLLGPIGTASKAEAKSSVLETHSTKFERHRQLFRLLASSKSAGSDLARTSEMASRLSSWPSHTVQRMLCEPEFLKLAVAREQASLHDRPLAALPGVTASLSARSAC